MRHKKQIGNRRVANPKKGITNDAEFQEAREDAKLLASVSKRKEKMIRVSHNTHICVPLNTSQELIEKKVLRCKQRLGMVKLESDLVKSIAEKLKEIV